MSESTKAVFLSYAREDTDAAKRIAEALRGFGVEVWFDQSELRGGDQWDARIRGQIKTCTLFIPIISATTQARDEAYFRLEWKLADDRSHLMAPGKAFIVPVVIDPTPETGATVPESFARAQWTRLEGGNPSTGFIEQVKHLLESPRKPTLKPDLPRPPTLPPEFKQAAQARAEAVAAASAEKKSGVPGWAWALAGIAFVAFGAGLLFLRQPAAPAPAAEKSLPPQASSPPPATSPAVAAKSIAVLPFANMSADKDNDFLADGIHEDVLTSLAKIRDLKVISRTSVLAYRDTAARNLKKIAADLGVAVVLEGSVRRSGDKVRVTAQLIDARTDEHLWAENYDGDTSDVFALQAKLAQQIAGALKATLTPGELSLIERRPTQDAQAYEYYQRAKLFRQRFAANTGRADYESAVSLYEQALARDPNLALAWGDLAFVHGVMYWFGAVDPTPARRARAATALAEVQRLAPGAPETRMAQGAFAYLCENDWTKALAELRAAETGLPNDDQLQYLLAIAHRRLGSLPAALAHVRRAVDLNPHERRSVTTFVETNFVMRRYADVLALAPRFLTQFPEDNLLQEFFIDAQFAVDGDRAAWLRKLAARPPAADDPHGLIRALELAMSAGDPVAADRVLVDERQAWYPGSGAVIQLPASLLRAEVALWRGDPAAARQHAADAIRALQSARWSPRQEPVVAVATARARVCAGEPGGAAELQQALVQLALRDKFVIAPAWSEALRTLALAGHTEAAFAVLRLYAPGPMVESANELRNDRLLARLQADPRFEEILKTAQPL